MSSSELIHIFQSRRYTTNQITNISSHIQSGSSNLSWGFQRSTTWGTRRPSLVTPRRQRSYARAVKAEQQRKIWDILGILEHIGDFWCSKTKHKKGLPPTKSGSIWLPESPYRFSNCSFSYFPTFFPVSGVFLLGSEIAGNFSQLIHWALSHQAFDQVMNKLTPHDLMDAFFTLWWTYKKLWKMAQSK